MEIDSRKRIIAIPLFDCYDLKHDLKGTDIPVVRTEQNKRIRQN
jgi:hypothetical protein